MLQRATPHKPNRPHPPYTHTQKPAAARTTTNAMRMSLAEDGSADRKGFLQGLAGLGLAVAALGATPAPAQAASLAKVNSELAGYGLPPMLDLPGGFSPLVEVYGKTAGAKKERPTFLVQVGRGYVEV